MSYKEHCECCEDCLATGLWAAMVQLRDVLGGGPVPEQGNQEFNSVLRTVWKLRRWLIGVRNDAQAN